MIRQLFTFSLFIPALLIFGCSKTDTLLNTSDKAIENNTGDTKGKELEQKVIYGNDDRMDYYQIASKNWRKISESTVALMQSSSLKEVSNQTLTKVNTTVKRIQTKHGRGRNFIELQDIMRHILKVPSRRVSAVRVRDRRATVCLATKNFKPPLMAFC